MKLLTLLTTLIITLASSNVFAQTFVCTDWRLGEVRRDGQVKKGTMFVGTKKGDILIIRDDTKTEYSLILLGKWFDNEYYADKSRVESTKNFADMYGVLSNARKYYYDYDFVISRHFPLRIASHTFCNWE